MATHSTAPRAIITGASSGIGKEFAKIFAREGYDLCVVARNEIRLEALAQEIKERHPERQIDIHSCDLSSSSERGRFIEAIIQSDQDYDVLVNNAGLGQFGFFKELDWQRIQNMVDLNVMASTHLMHFFVKCQSAKKRYVLNVASTAAFQPGPLMAVYYATKAYILNLGVALSSEFKDHNVVVSTLCPGPTETEFFKVAGMETQSKLTRNLPMVGPQEVAEFGYRALFKEKPVAIPGLFNRVLAQTNRILSRSLAADITRKLQEHR